MEEVSAEEVLIEFHNRKWLRENQVAYVSMGPVPESLGEFERWIEHINQDPTAYAVSVCPGELLRLRRLTTPVPENLNTTQERIAWLSDIGLDCAIRLADATLRTKTYVLVHDITDWPLGERVIAETRKMLEDGDTENILAFE